MWDMVNQELARDGPVDAGGKEPLVQPDHQAPVQSNHQAPFRPDHRHPPIQLEYQAPVQPDDQAAEPLNDRYLEELAQDLLQRHGGSLTEAASVLFGDGSKRHPASADEPGENSLSCRRWVSLKMNASSRPGEGAPIPPPHRDQDPPRVVDGAGGSAGQAHPLLDGHWTAERDAFLQGMVAYGGRQDWAGKAAVLNECFTESFTKKQVFTRVPAHLWERCPGQRRKTRSCLPKGGGSVVTGGKSRPSYLDGASRRSSADLEESVHRHRRSLRPPSPRRRSQSRPRRKTKILPPWAPVQQVIGQASKLPSSLVRQNKGQKQKETGDR